MDFTPDVCMAKRSCDGDGFSTYSRAYINTNEKLRLSMKYMPKNCNKALVCTASGDHALFASLYGAERVDVFDVSYNAKCIIDMKVAALNCLNREEYSDFLDDLYNQKNIRDVCHIKKISPQLPTQEWQYLCELDGYRFFNRGIVADFFGYDDPNGRALTALEYQKLQRIVNKPYNFIMTDIANLGAYLTENYDFMHLSNIFDYIDKKERFDVLESLFKHVNIDGRIVIQHMGRFDNVWKMSPIPIDKIFSPVFWQWRFKMKKNRVTVLERVR